MSPKKVLAFLCVCLGLLMVVTCVFPEKGIKLGNRVWYFASLSDWFSSEETRNDTLPTLSPEVQLARMAEAFRWKQLSELADSLAWYQQFFESSQVSICFPNNDPSLFDPVFEAMEQAVVQQQVVRVLHYGDSQIEQDRITSSLRAMLQDLFGGSGVGLVPAVQPIQTMTSRQEAWGDWHRYTLYGPQEKRASHRRYGPMAMVCELSDSAGLRIKSLNRFSRVKLLYCPTSESFKASLCIGHRKETRIVNDSSTSLCTLTWQLPQAVSSFELLFYGQAEIYGLLLDGEGGVAVDNVPMRGCSGTIFSRMDATILRQAYAEMNVCLFVLEYGGNRIPSIKSEDDVNKYCRTMANQFTFIKRLVPNAAILFIGPADMSCSVDGVMQTHPMLETLIVGLKKTCLDHGVAFWDMYRVMGGHNAMLDWVKTQPPLASADHIHFSQKGAKRIADLLNQSLKQCYDYYCFRRQHLDDSSRMAIQSLNPAHDYAQDFYDLLPEEWPDSLWNDISDEALYEELMQRMSHHNQKK